MIVVKRDPTSYRDGFLVKVSEPGTGLRGYTRKADTIQEAANAVLHYYGASHDKSACAMCKSKSKSKGGKNA